MMWVFFLSTNENGGRSRTTAADIGTEHDGILGVATEFVLVETVGEELDVSATAIDLLLILGAVLKDKGLALVVEGLVHLGGEAVEASVGGSLDTLVVLISVPLTSGPLPGAHLGSLSPVLGLDPSVLVT